jgi:hypothetical protein
VLSESYKKTGNYDSNPLVNVKNALLAEKLLLREFICGFLKFRKSVRSLIFRVMYL